MLAFWVLYQNKRSDEYLPAWKFVGEVEIPGRAYGFMSYKCPARLSDLYNENPGLLERIVMTGKSGAKYYGYRFSKDARPSMISDPMMRKFYETIKTTNC